MGLVSILTINPRLGPLSYEAGGLADLVAGALVSVPLGSRTIAGVMREETHEAVDPGKLRAIASRSDLPPLSQALLKLVDWVADYYVVAPSAVLRMVLASGIGLSVPERARTRATQIILDPDYDMPRLSADQTAAATRLTDVVNAAKFAPVLLDGVTGSGKTEVYFEAIAAALRAGKQALVLLPEIALTIPFLARFEARFGSAPLVWHSDLTPAQRRDAFRAIAFGNAGVVIGARSALFLPYPKLGLIVIDEAHDVGFKQDEGVPYHARDVAVMRARLEGIPVVLATATPALETQLQVQLGHYTEVKLPRRYGGARLPEMHVLDMIVDPPEREAWLAPKLVEQMAARLESGEQSLLFLNRRGFAPLTLCRTCGHRFQCPDCSAWMVEHRHFPRLQCHHCGHVGPRPATCPECNDTDSLVACGPGVERIAEEAATRFPEARVAIATSDTLNSAAKIAAFGEAMRAGETDIVVGTQIVTKGYHFPKLTLVGIVDADLGLQGGDLRAAERCFQQISQVGGRAGRAERPGAVYIQTHAPDAPVIQALLSDAPERFYALELAERRVACAPPFARYAAIILSDIDAGRAERFARALAQSAPKTRAIRIYGPAPAPLARLRGRYRFRLLIHAERSAKLQDYIRAWLAANVPPHSLRITVDVDPYNFS